MAPDMSDIEKPAFETDEHAQFDGPVPEHKHVDGNIQLLDPNNRVQRVPIPSGSPRDPLNWSKSRKCLVIVSCCWFSVMSLALVGNAGPLIPYWIGGRACLLHYLDRRANEEQPIIPHLRMLPFPTSST